MTHNTGPRPHVIEAFRDGLEYEFELSGATQMEAFEAMYQFQMSLLAGNHAARMELIRKMVAPLEDDLCPTCPKDAPVAVPGDAAVSRVFDK
jgi:hypothetical protein